MLKERNTSSLTVPYDYYLADLFREMEAVGVPTIIPSGKRLVRAAGSKAEDAEAVSLVLPPTPRIFEPLPLDALTNIRWGVKIYHDYLKPLGAEDLNRRANALYAMAQESAKNQGEDEKCERAVEKYLTTTMLANRRESQQEDAYLYFFLLALMRIGMLRHTLEGGDTPDASPNPDIYEIERSIDRGLNCLRKQDAARRAYKRRQRDENEESRKHGGAGGKKKNQKRYASQKEYARARFEELRKLPPPASRSSQMAVTIAKELKEKCGSEIESILVASETIRKRWIPEFKKKKKEKCPPTP